MPRGYSSPCGIHDYPISKKPKRCPQCPKLIEAYINELMARLADDPKAPYQTHEAREKRRAAGQKNRALHGSGAVTSRGPWNFWKERRQ